MATGKRLLVYIRRAKYDLLRGHFRPDKHVLGGPLNRVFGKAAHASTWIVSAPIMNINTYKVRWCYIHHRTCLCHWVGPIPIRKGCKWKFLYQHNQLTLRNRLSRWCVCSRRRRHRRHARFCCEKALVEEEPPTLHRSLHSLGGRTSAPCWFVGIVGWFIVVLSAVKLFRSSTP